MAKAKKGGKTTKTGKLPKMVAGIELPKELRKQGGKLLDLVKNPLVGDLVAAGLVALAANVRNHGKTGGDSAKDKQTGWTKSNQAGISARAIRLQATLPIVRPGKQSDSRTACNTIWHRLHSGINCRRRRPPRPVSFQP